MSAKRTMIMGFVAFLSVTGMVLAHCQVPCGIYGDDLRFALMREHVTTIEKSMKEIVRLASDKQTNANQLVRWVDNKENHADELSQIVTYYFMTQRVKPLPKGASDAQKKEYVVQITQLHEMLVYAMKAKQTTDVANCARLREAIDTFEKSYKSK